MRLTPGGEAASSEGRPEGVGEVALVGEAAFGRDRCDRPVRLRQHLPRRLEAMALGPSVGRNADRAAKAPRECRDRHAAHRRHLGERDVAGEIGRKLLDGLSYLPARNFAPISCRDPRLRRIVRQEMSAEGDEDVIDECLAHCLRIGKGRQQRTADGRGGRVHLRPIGGEAIEDGEVLGSCDLPQREFLDMIVQTVMVVRRTRLRRLFGLAATRLAEPDAVGRA